jgi:hypothetical protein
MIDTPNISSCFKPIHGELCCFNFRKPIPNAFDICIPPKWGKEDVIFGSEKSLVWFAFKKTPYLVYLSGVWLGISLRMDANKTLVHKRLDYMLKIYQPF